MTAKGENAKGKASAKAKANVDDWWGSQADSKSETSAEDSVTLAIAPSGVCGYGIRFSDAAQEDERFTSLHIKVQRTIAVVRVGMDGQDDGVVTCRW